MEGLHVGHVTRKNKHRSSAFIPTASYLNHKMTTLEANSAYQRAIDRLELSINDAELHIIDHSAVAMAKRHSDVLMWLGLVG